MYVVGYQVIPIEHGHRKCQQCKDLPAVAYLALNDDTIALCWPDLRRRVRNWIESSNETAAYSKRKAGGDA